MTPIVVATRRLALSKDDDTRSLFVAVVVGLLGLGTYLWQISVPIYLQLYDSGVYLAGAMHLVSGVMPYRDFAFVQPPGILILLSPVALLSRLLGTHEGFLVARIIGACVSALDASLLAWLVRRRGMLAMFVSGIGLALTPVAMFFSSEIRLEPYCFLFLLLGSLKVASSRTSPSPSTRAIVVAGVLFGLAASIEFWAFFAFLAMVLSLVPDSRRRALGFALGAGAGLIAPCLPFLLVAPRAFVTQVFLEQLHHPHLGGTLGRRLVEISGFAGTNVAPSGAEALCGFIALIAVGAVVVDHRKYRVIESYLLLSSILCLVGLLAAPAAYTDYGYFAAPFFFGVLGLIAARIGEHVVRLSRIVLHSSVIRRFVGTLGAIAGVAFVVGALSFDTTFYSIDLPLTGVNASAISSLSRAIPKGSCVIYDTVGMGLVADRFVTSDPECPALVDPYGESMAWGYQLGSPQSRAVAFWRTNLADATYLVVAVPIAESPEAVHQNPYQGMISWNESLLSWFKDHYRLQSCRPECVYRRVT